MFSSVMCALLIIPYRRRRSDRGFGRQGEETTLLLKDYPGIVNRGIYKVIVD